MGDRRNTVPAARFSVTDLTAPAALVAVILLIADWPTWKFLVADPTYGWLYSAQYSHGLLVVPFIAWLFWSRRDQFPVADCPAPLLGIGCLLIGGLARVAGGVMDLHWLEGFALVATALGVVALFAGAKTFRFVLPGILFFLFAVPLPYRFEIMLGFPLQRAATVASTYVMQTLGQPAIAEGNTILVRDFHLGIVEACSGLRMLVTFFTFSTAVCLATKRPFTDKLVIMLSAVPIALATNILRIVVTGFMYMNVSSQTASAFFHDAAGWFMMPVALAFLGLELWVLGKLFVATTPRIALR